MSETQEPVAAPEAPAQEVKQPLTIKETKELLVFLFQLGSVVKEAKENDGKVTYMDSVLLMKLLPTVGPAIEGIDQVDDEIKDLDATEVDQLVAYIGEETGKIIAKEHAVAQILAGLQLGKALYAFVKTLKK